MERRNFRGPRRNTGYRDDRNNDDAEEPRRRFLINNNSSSSSISKRDNSNNNDYQRPAYYSGRQPVATHHHHHHVNHSERIHHPQTNNSNNSVNITQSLPTTSIEIQQPVERQVDQTDKMMAEQRHLPLGAIEMLELIHKEYKTYECSACSKNFGYQLKANPSIKFCTTECLAVGCVNLDEIIKCGGIPHAHSHAASPDNISPGLSSTSRASNGFSDTFGFAGKSPYHQSEKSEDVGGGEIKARLLSTLHGVGSGPYRNGRAGSHSDRGGRSNSGRGRPTLTTSTRPSLNLGENPFFKGEDRVDKSRDETDCKSSSSGPSQLELDAAFERNPKKEALEKAAMEANKFKTIEQQEMIRKAQTQASEPQQKVPLTKNPLVERPKLKAVANNEQVEIKKPEVKVAAPITLTQITKPVQKEDVPPAPPKILKPTKPTEVKVAEKTPSPVVVQPAKKVWNMTDLLTSTSLYDLAPCVVAFPWSAKKFTLYADSDEGKRNKLQEEVQAYSSSAPPLTRVPAINDIVFAPYFGDFFRAKVVKVDGENVTVSFIYYGDAADLKLSECKEPSDSIMKNYPVYGVIFSLALDVKVPDDLQLPFDLTEKKVTIKIEQRELDNWSGILTLDDNRSLNDIVRETVQPKPKVEPTPAAPKLKPILKPSEPLAPKSNGPPPLKPLVKPSGAPKTNSNDSPTPVMKTESTPPPQQKAPSPAPQTTEPPKPVARKSPFASAAGKPSPAPSPPSSKWNVKTVKISPNLKHGATVNVNYIWDFGKVNISAAEDGKNLEHLQFEVDTYVKTAPANTTPLKTGDIVLAPYGDVFYRGRVADINGDQVNVIFLDYGDTVAVKLSEVKEVTDKIMQHPIYGVDLKVNDVPESCDQIESAQVDAAVENGGQLELTSGLDIFDCTGQIWLTEEQSWSELVSEVLKAAGK